MSLKRLLLLAVLAFTLPACAGELSANAAACEAQLRVQAAYSEHDLDLAASRAVELYELAGRDVEPEIEFALREFALAVIAHSETPEDTEAYGDAFGTGINTMDSANERCMKY